MKVHTTIDSPFGRLTLVNTDGVLSGLFVEIPGRKTDPARLGQRMEQGFEQITGELREYFAGRRTEFSVPVAPIGDAFQQRVWQLLMRIPYGQTRTYGELAAALGDRSLARAVGVANARNPIAVVIPCHRVVGADGSLTGYAGGLERKAFLLELEDPSRGSQLELLTA